MNPLIREETSEDFEAIRSVNLAAFQGVGEADLVDQLRSEGYVELSLVAVVNGEVVGHLLLSKMQIRTAEGELAALSLAPMAVLPEFQRGGVGTRLMQAGLSLCRERGHAIVLVLGHPDYYRQFGFSSELAESIASPFGGGEAWMALELTPGALEGVRGEAVFSPPFQMFE
ncbi:putative N-acetyltransferase YhbS [Planctomycetales bacterium 10988]|nr:putative N-acetyltransferase YhbS [Planctomycetales bacterium 10988]